VHHAHVFTHAVSDADEHALRLLCLCVRYDFVIVSYDMLMDVKDVLMAVEFKVVILDESHCIKNSQVRHSLWMCATLRRSCSCHDTIMSSVGEQFQPKAQVSWQSLQARQRSLQARQK
jgi:septum formation inhibitor-activating ATPase MinD